PANPHEADWTLPPARAYTVWPPTPAPKPPSGTIPNASVVAPTNHSGSTTRATDGGSTTRATDDGSATRATGSDSTTRATDSRSARATDSGSATRATGDCPGQVHVGR